jgi:GNAT superfamily N-acetyltransferase
VAVLAQDEQGQLVAGVIGWMWGQCVEINYLWVQPDRRGRGYGRRLLQTIEAEAQRQGCHTAMLDTYTFQAPGFYQKFGYEVFGVVDGFPNGYQKLFLKKRLSVRGATDEQPNTPGK